MSALYGDHHNLDDSELRYALYTAGIRLAELRREVAELQHKIGKLGRPTIADKLASERAALAAMASHIDARIMRLEEHADNTPNQEATVWLLGFLAGRASGLREAERAFDRLQREEEES